MRSKGGRSVFIGAICLITSLAYPMFAGARSSSVSETRSTGPCMGEEGFSDAWLDRTHVYINRILCQPSVWFDNFFGEHRVGDEWPGSLVRWKNSYRLDEKENDLFNSKFDADLRLPKASRLKLVIASRSGESEPGTLPDEDRYGIEDPAVAEGERQTTAGLRLLVSQTRRITFSLGSGLRFDTPLDPYIRARLRITEPLGRTSLIRLTPSAIMYRDEGLIRSLRLDLERRVGENILLRASETGKWKEGRPGIRWGTELSFLDRLSPRTVMSIRASATGETQPFVYTDRYRLALKIRENVYRPWFFVEVEPEIYWPRDEEGNYGRYHALTFRVEIQFFS